MDRAIPILLKRSNLLAGLVLLVLVAVGPAFAVLVNFQRELRGERDNQARRIASQQAEMVNATLSNAVEGTHQMLAALSVSQAVRGFDPSCGMLLQDIRHAMPAYGAIAVFRQDGTPVCSDAAGGEALDALAKLAQPLLSATSFVTGTYTDLPALAPPMLSFAQPFAAADGIARGVLVAGLDLGRLNTLLGSLKQPASGRTIVADRNGLIVACAPDEAGLIGSKIRPELESLAEAAAARGGCLLNLAMVQGA